MFITGVIGQNAVSPYVGGGGDDWTQISSNGLNSGGGGSTITALASYGLSVFVAGLVGGYAARSIDGGITWAALTRGLNSGANNTITAIAMNNDGYGVAVFSSGYASRTTDGGATWSGLTRWLNSGASGTTSIQDVACVGSTFVAVLEAGYAAISYDNGATWEALVRGLNSGATNTLFYSVAGGPQSTFIAMGSFRGGRSNTGATWTALSPQGLDNEVGAQGIAGNLDISPGGTVIIGRQTGYYDRSLDFGVSWSDLTRGLSSGDVNNQAGPVVNDGKLTWVCSHGEDSCISTDNGSSFSNLPTSLNAASVGAVISSMCTNKAGIWIAGLSGGFACRSPAP